ncbi:MAG: hypothetical protein ABWZ40_03235, partial [Caulobacterales bacterium]
MKQRLIAGVARVTFGAIFVVGCAAAAWAMPPASLIEALPKASEADAAIVPPASDAQRFTPPTPRIAPQRVQVLLASSVLRTLDGQAWTPPASLAAADAPAPEAAAPVLETAPAATPDAAIAQALDHAAAVQDATPAAPLAEALAVEAPLVVAASPAMTAAPEAVTETPAAPPPLATLEFNPAAVLHIEDIAAAPNESADKFPPAARLRNARPQRAAP